MSDPLAPAEIRELLCALVAVPSVNPSVAPAEAHTEAAVAQHAAGWLSAHGVKAVLEEAAPGRPNVYAEVGEGHALTLCLCAHLDTVGTEGMTVAPFTAKVEGNRIYGRGSYDMKGGAAAIMAAAAALAAGPPLRGRVILALVCDEEYASLGADDFVRRHRADACILTEPSELQLILGHKGFVWAEITTEGVAAHGSRWDLGRSAIGRMGRIISELEHFDREVLRRRVHPLVGPASLHCALVEGGSGISTYAPHCRLKVERRTIPGETPEQVRRELRDVVATAGEEATVACFFSRPPLLCDRDEAVVKTLRSAALAVNGSAPAEAGVAYWMDAAVFAAAGIPACNFGPAGAGAHAAVEWVDLDSVVSVARVLVETARRFCR